MTAKEKFESEVKEYGAFRVESITDAVVYAALYGGAVFIFCHPDAGYWDKYDCGRPCSTLLLPEVMQSAFVWKGDMPEQVARTLDDLYGEESVCENDMLHAVVWLWNNTSAFDDIWGKHGTLHVEYEDDEEPMTPAELAVHRDFFGEVFTVLRELGRVYGGHFTERVTTGVSGASGAGRQIVETRLAMHQLIGTMLGCGEMLEKRYVENEPEEQWASGGGSLARRLEACYWLMYGIVREMDADMRLDEEAYAFGDQRVQRLIYEFCVKACGEIERLRTEENADV